MIIPITLSPPPDRIPAPLQPALAKLGSKEVVLIELQGWLDVVEGEKDDGLIGILDMEHDKPILKIGHHHLEGKLVSLSKPLAVLARETAGKHDPEALGGSTRYDILSVIRRKITFSNRPIPIVKHP